MSHLEEQLSALIDGELTGAELDRVHAHLAACGSCRAEVAALRDLKRQLRGMPVLQPADELTSRLLAMAGPGGPVPPRRLRRGNSAPRPAFRPYSGTTSTSHSNHYPERSRGSALRSARPPRDVAGRPPGLRRRDSRGPGVAANLRRHGRYIVLGAVSIAVTVGIGAAAFTMGGSGSPAPRITPQLELFSVEHASNNGQVPLIDPSPSASGSGSGSGEFYQVTSPPPP